MIMLFKVSTSSQKLPLMEDIRYPTMEQLAKYIYNPTSSEVLPKQKFSNPFSSRHCSYCFFLEQSTKTHGCEVLVSLFSEVLCNPLQWSWNLQSGSISGCRCALSFRICRQIHPPFGNQHIPGFLGNHRLKSAGWDMRICLESNKSSSCMWV